MREFTVNLPLQRVALDEFIDRAAWVPHVNIQSNPTTEADPRVVVEAVRAAIDGVKSMKAIVGEEARFGPEGSLLVNLVQAPVLRALHDIVHARFRDDAGAVSINPAADGDGFRPHVTVTKRGRAREGDEVVLNQAVGRSSGFASRHRLDGRAPAPRLALGAWLSRGPRRRVCARELS